jgi:hypothetical protein
VRHPKTRTKSSLSGEAVRRQTRPAIGQESPTLGAARTESRKEEQSRKELCRVVEVVVRQAVVGQEQTDEAHHTPTVGEKRPALEGLEEQLLATGRKRKSQWRGLTRV